MLGGKVNQIVVHYKCALHYLKFNIRLKYTVSKCSWQCISVLWYLQPDSFSHVTRCCGWPCIARYREVQKGKCFLFPPWLTQVYFSGSLLDTCHIQCRMSLSVLTVVIVCTSLATVSCLGIRLRSEVWGLGSCPKEAKLRFSGEMLLLQTAWAVRRSMSQKEHLHIFLSRSKLKRYFTQKRNILSLITPPHVVPNL